MNAPTSQHDFAQAGQNAAPAPRPPRVILFDCDGTITGEDYLPYIVGRTLAEKLTELQRAHPELNLAYNEARFEEVFKTNMGGGFDKYLGEYKKASDKAGENIDLLAEEAFLTAAVANYIYTLEAFMNGGPEVPFEVNPGMIEGMQEAVSAGDVVLIVTNARSEIVRANMAAAGIYVRGEPIPDGVTPKVLIDGVICLDDVKRAAAIISAYSGKPVDWKTLRKPAEFIYTLARLKASEILSRREGRPITVEPEHCIGAEDSRNGHEALLRDRIGTRLHISQDTDLARPFTFKVNGQEFAPHFVVRKGAMSAALMRAIIQYHDAHQRGEPHVTLEGISPNDLLWQPAIV